MKLGTIKNHLKPYSIVGRRRTTINHAFASALAPCDIPESKRLAEAMAVLGQTDMACLRCVYCERIAETWDHLVGLVKASELHGYGHQIGNLVPCCRDCNSRKGNRKWKDFLRSNIMDPVRCRQIERMLGGYLRKFAKEVDLEIAAQKQPKEWQRYCDIKQEIFKLMAEADGLAEQLRAKVTKSASEK